MGLSKLRIVPEKHAGKLDFDEGEAIEALFNPDELSLSSSIGWKKNNAQGRDVPELAFTNSEPRSLTIKLLFDTYDNDREKKPDVRKTFTDKVFNLSVVNGDKHRPPVCKLKWGAAEEWFMGVLERLDQKFTMFMEDGTPVRATLTCTFKEWRTNQQDQQRQNRKSSDIDKQTIMRRGDSLSAIAAQEYLDPAQWRPIAMANGIDDPLRIPPGRRLSIPRLPLDRKLSRG